MVRKMEGRSRIEPLFDVLRMTYVRAVCCFAQKDMDVERHAVKSWWSRWDSNPRPPRCHRGALPTAPRPHRRNNTNPNIAAKSSSTTGEPEDNKSQHCAPIRRNTRSAPGLDAELAGLVSRLVSARFRGRPAWDGGFGLRAGRVADRGSVAHAFPTSQRLWRSQ